MQAEIYPMHLGKIKFDRDFRQITVQIRARELSVGDLENGLGRFRNDFWIIDDESMG